MKEPTEETRRALERAVTPSALMLFGLGGLAATAALAELALPLLIVGGCVGGAALVLRRPPPAK